MPKILDSMPGRSVHTIEHVPTLTQVLQSKVVIGDDLSNKVFVGIDPGAGGGIAILEGETVHLKANKKGEHSDTWKFLTMCKIDFAVIEQVTGYIPRKGDASDHAHGGQPGSAMFTFGRSYGILEGMLVATGAPYQHATPREWQKTLGVSKEKGLSDNHWKNQLKDHACELFPGIKVTLATADALLLAYYARGLCE